MTKYRYLNVRDLVGMRGIDLSDYSSRWCSARNGKIVQKARVFHYKGFSTPTGLRSSWIFQMHLTRIEW